MNMIPDWLAPGTPEFEADAPRRDAEHKLEKTLELLTSLVEYCDGDYRPEECICGRELGHDDDCELKEAQRWLARLKASEAK